MPRVAQSLIDARRHAITSMLLRQAYLPVGELCRRFNISQATARRDLAALSKDRNIVRTYGGAMADYDRSFAPFTDRLSLAAEAKANIALAALKLISPAMTVFLDAGTTIFAITHLLKHRPIPIQIVTNSLAVAQCLASVKGINMDLLGGRLLTNQSVLLGRQTCRAAEAYKFDLALLGAEGFDTRGIWNSTPDVVALQKVIIQRSRRHAVCADATKQGIRTSAFLLPWKHLDLLITDSHLKFDVSIKSSQIINVQRN